MTSLKEVRERDAFLHQTTLHDQEDIDRRHLLNLVERMRPYLMHDIETDCMPSYCTCGLYALLEELK